MLKKMKSIFEKIQELEDIAGYSKHEQFVQGVINAIDDKLLVRGDMLPSVNNMIQEVGFARETIMKGYRELKDRGIIESKNRLGFFVANADTEQTLKVALMMFAFDAFQELFYRNFRAKLGENIHLDVFFHHNNIEVFDTILNHIKGKYGMYVVSPIPHPKTKELLQSIPLSKLLMYDRFEAIGGDFSHITQEFEASSYRIFTELADRLRDFDEFLFYYHPNSMMPIEILRAYKKFLKDHNIKGGVRKNYEAGSVEKGKAYFIIDNIDLFQFLKDCKEKNLKLGVDVGILSHNDDPMKEIIADGITTYATDFGLIGTKSAQFVLTREKIQETMPMVLIRRNSL
jgi:DNA-binding transcriptional regulator YhcF (GntR family)